PAPCEAARRHIVSVARPQEERQPFLLVLREPASFKVTERELGTAGPVPEVTGAPKGDGSLDIAFCDDLEALGRQPEPSSREPVVERAPLLVKPRGMRRVRRDVITGLEPEPGGEARLGVPPRAGALEERHGARRVCRACIASPKGARFIRT